MLVQSVVAERNKLNSCRHVENVASMVVLSVRG
jgi:hypothetical protein